MMSAVRGKNTQPELTVRSALFEAGFRYRLHYKKLPGNPDLVLPKYKIAVFVHGCFWHGHTCRKGQQRPSSNEAFWSKKLDGNLERDRRNISALRAVGWKPVVIWGCSIEKDTRKLLSKLRRLSIT